MRNEDFCKESHKVGVTGEENEENAPVPTMNHFELMF
jgi:hypothetical protein